MKIGKLDIYKVLLGIIAISLIGFCIFTTYHTNILKTDAEGLTHIETIASGIQRVSKLELEGASDLVLFVELEKIASELFSSENSESKYFKNNDEIKLLVQQVQEHGEEFRTAVLNLYETGNRDILFVASENNYNNTTTIASKIDVYIKELTNFVGILETVCIAHVVVMALLLLKILMNTSTELKKNKEMSATMFIDTSTGLYNRSKCQEILKSAFTSENAKERAVIIFDLNDLKKTNDGQGHRAGDDLISCFAEQLRNATGIFSYEVFVGRYGGDEFMAYFASTVEKDVELYIKEVNYLMKEFNEKGEKPFALSCAAGYCITTEDTKSMTMRELFDIADETMYKNKLAMKEKKRQELAEKGIVEPTVIDERLL